MPMLAVVGSGAILLVGALSILLGYYVELGVIGLTLFLLPVTLTMHSFWADKDPMMKQTNVVMFLKNFVILGAAWMFLSIPDDAWDYAIAP
jgi:putative oxidoreductase